MDKNFPLITIVTVCRNAVNEIERTMLSVLNQTYPNIEYIVIDGASTDGTVDIIKKYANRLAYWVSEPDKGIYDAMNKGIEKATGEWINFMNAGDEFAEEATITSIFGKEEMSSEIIYGNTIYQTVYGSFVSQGESVDTLRHRLPFCHQSCFILTKLAKENPYENEFHIAADYNFFYKMYMLGHSYEKVDVNVSKFDNIGGISTKNVQQLIEEYCKINEDNYYYRILIYKSKRFVRDILKSVLPKQKYQKLQEKRKEKKIGKRYE